MKFAGLSILLKSEASPHVANSIGSSLIAQAFRSDFSVGGLVLKYFAFGAVNHLLRYRNP
jgi:hypothetical protein